MKLNIGFAALFVLLLACSSTMANEMHHQNALSKLMKVQNCSFDLAGYNVTNINVQRLHAQHLETLRNVNYQITQSAVAKLIRDDPRLVTLARKLSSDLRFGSDCVSATLSEDIQLGTGALNYRESIHSTGEVLSRFAHSLYKLADEWKVATVEYDTVDTNQSPSGLEIQGHKENLPLASKLTQIKQSALNRLVQVDLAQSPTFHPIAVQLLGGFKFDQKFPHGIGKFNRPKSAFESAKLLERFANALTGIADKWNAQLLRQKQSCERYLQDTFVPPVVLNNNPCNNATMITNL